MSQSDVSHCPSSGIGCQHDFDSQSSPVLCESLSPLLILFLIEQTQKERVLVEMGGQNTSTS